MKIEEIIRLGESELNDYCKSLNETHADGWEEISNEDDGYFRNGSKWTHYYSVITWRRDGWELSCRMTNSTLDFEEDIYEDGFITEIKVESVGEKFSNIFESSNELSLELHKYVTDYLFSFSCAHFNYSKTFEEFKKEFKL